MITVETRYFGAVSEDVGLAIEFPAGLPAFEGECRFLAIEHPRTSPLVLLQSTATADLCFLALPVHSIDPGYRLQMSPEDMGAIGIADTAAADIAVLAFIVVDANGGITANLMAPVIVNRENRRAVQSVRWDGAYAHDHPILMAAGALAREGSPCS